MRKKVNQTGKKVLLLLCLVMLAQVAAPMPAQAAVSKKTKALGAYKKFLAKNEKKDSRFSIIYLDKDSVPELVYSEPDNLLYEVYTWKNNKIKKIFKASKSVSNRYKITGYYKKKGVYTAKGYSGAVGMEAKYYFTYKNGKYVPTWDIYTSFGEKEYHKRSGNRITEITSSQLNKALKKKTGKTKVTKISYRKNNIKNRNKYLK